MKGENIQNLSSLWETAGKKFNAFYKDHNISVAKIIDSDWPNRIWTDKKITKKTIETIKSKMEKEDDYTFSYFNEDLKKSPSFTYSGFTLKSIQYGMNLPLNQKFETPNSVKLEKVTDKKDAGIWSETFYKAFQYMISARTVVKTMNDIEYFLVYHEEKIAGTIALFITGKVSGIHSLGIIPAARKQNLATMAMHQMLNMAIDQNLTLATLQASEMAKELYLGMGFSIEFIMENYQLNNLSQ